MMVWSTAWKRAGLVFCVIILIMIHVSRSSAEEGSVEERDWKSLDLKKDPLPSGLKAIMEQVTITPDHVEIEGANIFYQSANPPVGVERTGKTILLLHGAAFTSQTWVDQVPTIATLAALGHSVVAVDLPGYGKSRQEKVKDKGMFLASLIKTHAGYKPIVITPSMSGSFMVPMLEVEANRNLVSGWVPVAPVGTTQSTGFYTPIKIPTMIVFGEKDTGLGHRSRDDLVELPNSTLPQVLPDAGHPAYLDQPELWHTLLHNFINNINLVNIKD